MRVNRVKVTVSEFLLRFESIVVWKGPTSQLIQPSSRTSQTGQYPAGRVRAGCGLGGMKRFPLLRWRETAHKREIDINLFGNLEDEDAGVFQAPFHIGHREVRFGRQSTSVNVNLHGRRQVVRSAMKSEYPGNLNGGIARCRYSSLIAPGNEGDFGKVRHVQNLRVHVLVPALITAVSTACGDNYRS